MPTCCQMMLEYKIKPGKCWNNAPQWVRDKWTSQMCHLDGDVKSKSCKNGKTCCQLVVEHGFRVDKSNDEPQWLQDKWNNQKCPLHKDVTSKSCKAGKYLVKIHTFVKFLSYRNIIF